MKNGDLVGPAHTGWSINFEHRAAARSAVRSALAMQQFIRLFKSASGFVHKLPHFYATYIEFAALTLLMSEGLPMEFLMSVEPSIPDYPTIGDGLLDRGHATASASASLGGEGDAVAEILGFLREMSSTQHLAGTLIKFLHQLREGSSAVDMDAVVEGVFEHPAAGNTLSWAMRRALLEDHVRWLVDTFKEARRLAEPIVPLFSTLSLADGDG
ncbi:hypothetical protein HK405_007882, partial [Cladochytrium tenue]